MTIEKGKPWGRPSKVPSDSVLVRSDAEAATVLERCRESREPFPVLVLLGGDLCKTLGGQGDEERQRTGAAVRFRVDVGEVIVDGRSQLFLAHYVARSRLWTNGLGIFNAQWHGDWNVAPRGHPNDAKLEVFEWRLGMRSALQVAKRLSTGSHLPHPRIRHKSVDHHDAAVEAGVVEIDGRRVHMAGQVTIRVIPDALDVIV